MYILEIDDGECRTYDLFSNWKWAAINAALLWRDLPADKRQEYLDGRHAINLHVLDSGYTRDMYLDGIDMRAYFEKTHPMLEILDETWHEFYSEEHEEVSS